MLETLETIAPPKELSTELREVKALIEAQTDQIFESVMGEIKVRRYVPGATYRLQLNREFTFEDARQQVAYLHALGISDIYTSPYLRARKDSMHGYDICDHHSLNPSIGTEQDYRQLISTLQSQGMCHILDVVPNHMGIGETTNRWWMDVLENGQSSTYSTFFDIDWDPVKEELEHKVLLPILGEQYGRILERGELQLHFEPEEGAFYLDYYENRLPLEPSSYQLILNRCVALLEQNLGEESPSLLELRSIITALSYLPPHWESDPQKRHERNREKEVIKRRLAELSTIAPEVRVVILANLSEMNGTPNVPESFDALDNLVATQVYRLAYWRVATEEINYRRFFDVNDLAAIRVEDETVFEQTHELIMRLLGEGAINGLRIDHADGLWNPTLYLEQLQKRYFLELCRRAYTEQGRGDPLWSPNTGLDWTELETALLTKREALRESNPNSPLLTPLYVVVEKILGQSEHLPPDWKVAGTTGYDFGNQVNAILIDSDNKNAFDNIYRRFTGERVKYADLVYQSKRQIMRTALASEVNVLARLLNRLSERNRHSRDFTLNNLRFSLRELLACFPVYRTYTIAENGSVDKQDKAIIETAISRAKKRNPAFDPSVFDFLRDVLLLNYDTNADEQTKSLQNEFVMKFQQVSSPVMAKGVEDTVFYIYNRLIGLNEVGAEPEHFGQSLDTFHRQNSERQRTMPYSLLTTSTHDSKRSEDVRARLAVLSEMPQEWREALTRWTKLNRRRRVMVDGQLVPSRNEEYFIYQTILGVFPFGSEADDTEYAELIRRGQAYLVKALREAKVNSSWLSQNESYEAGVQEFIHNILNRAGINPFLDDFVNFQTKIAHFGMFNSLSQLLLKLTVPGVPDIYQGNELWNFSLVDPDNRRPVDYAQHAQLLATLPDQPTVETAHELLENRLDGRIKLYLTREVLHYRRNNLALFQEGIYQPLTVEGNHHRHVVAFARELNSKAVVTVVPRLLARLSGGILTTPLGTEWWDDTKLVVPELATYRNILTGESIAAQLENGQFVLPLREIFAHFPLALLEKQD